MARELVYTGFMSLDGVVDSPGGEAAGHRSGGWVARTEFDPEAFAPYWRDSEDHAAYKDLPKYVVSTTLTDDALFDGWGPTTILRSSDDIAKLKQSDGGGIFIHGSAELARRLSEADLVDRYNLLVFPVLLGAGKGLFCRDDRDKRQLRLRESASYANGVTKLVYDVVY
ncbi:dihydrofolate reductase family protein [Rhodococcus sp. NPDC058521]|uniref:dihydrofolate reductase family protein n=1 Tax=Rhodococcus sp. NPDC058521 TaxID=3346536 RepID=UPI003660968A